MNRALRQLVLELDPANRDGAAAIANALRSNTTITELSLGEPTALDESVESPDFNMAASYGESYLLMFITCLYATGMPILTWFAFFGFT